MTDTVFGRTITDLRAAVTRLGISTLRDLVLASEVFSLPAAAGVDRDAPMAAKGGHGHACGSH